MFRFIPYKEIANTYLKFGPVTDKMLLELAKNNKQHNESTINYILKAFPIEYSDTTDISSRTYIDSDFIRYTDGSIFAKVEMSLKYTLRIDTDVSQRHCTGNCVLTINYVNSTTKEIIEVPIDFKFKCDDIDPGYAIVIPTVNRNKEYGSFVVIVTSNLNLIENNFKELIEIYRKEPIEELDRKIEDLLHNYNYPFKDIIQEDIK